MKDLKEEENKIIDSLLSKYDLNSIKKLIEYYDIITDEEEYMEKKILRALKNIQNISILKEKYNSINKNTVENVTLNSLEEKNFNFIILGYTGCGKSTLTNAILQDELAKEGHSINPGISTFEQYSNPKKVPGITIFDTIGIEAISADRNLEQIKNEIKKTFEENLTNPDKSLHGILYCIRNGSFDKRIDPREINFIKELIKLYGEEKLIIVFTQSTNPDSEEKICNVKNALDNQNIEIIEVLARDSTILIGKKEVPVEAFGLDELIKTMKNRFQKSLIKSNLLKIEKKKKQEKYLSDLEEKSEEILKKLEKYELENTFIDECKYIMNYLIGEINLNINLNDLYKKLSRIIEDAYIDIKENLLKNEYPIWLLKLNNELNVKNKLNNQQLNHSSIKDNLKYKFDEYYENKIKDYIKKIIFAKALMIFVKQIKKIVLENIRDI